MHRVPISFLATTDAEASARFYQDVMGLRLVEDSPFALVLDDAGHMLRVQKVDEAVAVPYTQYGWEVDDIDAEIDRLTALGVDFQHFPQLEQSPRGVWTTPAGHHIAWFTDPVGNTLSLTQFVA